MFNKLYSHWWDRMFNLYFQDTESTKYILTNSMCALNIIVSKVTRRFWQKNFFAVKDMLMRQNLMKVNLLTWNHNLSTSLSIYLPPEEIESLDFPGQTSFIIIVVISRSWIRDVSSNYIGTLYDMNITISFSLFFSSSWHRDDSKW